MPTPSRGAATNRPANLANAIRVLYSEVDCRIEHGAESGGHLNYVRDRLQTIRVLADALEQREGPTWAERVERVLVPLPWYDTTRITLTRATVDAALRKAFPELAPSDD